MLLDLLPLFQEQETEVTFGGPTPRPRRRMQPPPRTTRPVDNDDDLLVLLLLP